MLSGADSQVHVMQHHPLPARYIHVPQFKKLASLRPLCRLRAALRHPTPNLLD